MVDALDHELLQLAARRMSVVSEIAAYKRQHHLRIRDPHREREILEDRARRAEEMGLPKGEIESLFRVLLRASRDHQAALRTELPYETPSLTIAVVVAAARWERCSLACSATSVIASWSPIRNGALAG
jgi:chorismate mutase